MMELQHSQLWWWLLLSSSKNSPSSSLPSSSWSALDARLFEPRSLLFLCSALRLHCRQVANKQTSLDDKLELPTQEPRRQTSSRLRNLHDLSAGKSPSNEIIRFDFRPRFVDLRHNENKCNCIVVCNLVCFAVILVLLSLEKNNHNKCVVLLGHLLASNVKFPKFLTCN